MHLLTLFGWTIPSGIAIKSYGDTSLLSKESCTPHLLARKTTTRPVVETGTKRMDTFAT